MRYKPEHKQATRDRIVAAAGRLFRRQGYQGTGVDAIMSEAGLTPGGFYAHFASKEALLLETLSRCLGERAASISQAVASDDPFTAMIQRYLCALHRDDPGTGCPLPNLAAEISRLTPGARGKFTAALEHYLADVQSLMPGVSPSKRRERAIATLSTLMGAMTLARAVSDKALSEEIFESVRHALLPAQKARPMSPTTARKKPRRR
jgi:TetR/AcrR family transcriptional repressor of nem operon